MLPRINKLKCVSTKNFALRLIHGDIYTGMRLQRFGLADTDECTKCRQRGPTIPHNSMLVLRNNMDKNLSALSKH